MKDQSIFKNYTGNAFLNNALMTIEALAKLKHVSEITPDILLKLYKEKSLLSLNKRLMSYTMLFTKNGPLHNDKTTGEKVYENLFKTIIELFENEGDQICEISGLKFHKQFQEVYTIALRKVGLTDKEIQRKDTSINRGWFPLIGGLGSDAQALPQAKFAINIHPICVALMQFLPLSALLYKRGVLAIDSSNFEFAKSFVADNVKEVANRIHTTNSSDKITNIKDYAKGNYLLKAISILEEKEIEDEYSDLNLWSFSNSGTGASCEIERVPNSLIKKLIRMKQNPKISNELKGILSRNSHRFLEDLENNQEWYLLFPNVFGTGKNKGDYEGVSVAFMEAYYKEINSPQKTEYAKYLSHLIETFKTDSFSKYLDKRDAWRVKDFTSDLYTVLVKATAIGKWGLLHHISILDDAEQLPVKNNFYNILKITHFYHYKQTFGTQIPLLNSNHTQTQVVCEWLIALIQQDERQETIRKDLLSVQEYLSTNFTAIFYRASQKDQLDLNSIFYALFDEFYQSTRFGLNGLLRIFFSQPKQDLFEIKLLEKPENWELDRNSKYWFGQINDFVQDFQAYYFDKYENKLTGEKPHNKFLNLIKAISNENSKFLIWFYEAIENTNVFLKSGDKNSSEKWSDALLYDPFGENALSFSKFAIKFSLFKQHQKALATIHYQLINN